jgi:glycine/sarcosine N-methyltransferase
MDDSTRPFYDEFAALHDRLVSFKDRKARELPFWMKLTQDFPIKKVLDISCGTGHHAVMFKEIGLRIDAMDLSEAMLAKARENAASEHLSIAFKKGDFRRIGETFPDTYDAIVCLGNSLPHMKGDDEVSRVLQEVVAHLVPSGLFVVEIRNYDFLMTQRPRFFPLSVRDNAGFIYALDYYPDEITFNILYLNTKTGEFRTFQTTYYPLYFDALKKLLAGSGLEVIQTWEDYSGAPFVLEKSPRLVVVCRKASPG